MKVTKILSLLLVTLMLVSSITACGKTTTINESSKSTDASTTTNKLGAKRTK